MEKDNPVDSITRKQAQSGTVSYGIPVVLHDSTKTQIVMVPFFIPRTGRTDLSIKIQTYKKAKAPFDHVLLDDKSVSLSEEAARRLLNALKSHIAVANEDEDGDYLVIKISDGTADTTTFDPNEVAAALIGVLSQSEIVSHLQDMELTAELAKAFRNSIRLTEMQEAVAVLRSHLDNDENAESVYQEWCNRHSWAFGNTFVVNDEVRTISAGDQADLLLPTIVAGYRDMVELKRPNMLVLRYDESHKNYYFSQDVSSAIGQCHRYLDIFSKVASDGLLDHPEIVAYHPRATIVIGRSKDWDPEQLKALHGLNSRLSGISIMTYDHLLSQGERLVSLLSGTNPDETPTNHHALEIDSDEDLFF